MAKGIVLKGNNYNEMIQKGLKKIGLDKKEVDIKIFKLKNEDYLYKVRISRKENSQDKLKSGVSYESDFDIDFNESGVYLKLHKKNELDSGFLQYIEKYIAMLNIEELNLDKFKMILNSKDVFDGVIAPVQDKPKIDEEIKITIDKDKLRASVEFYPSYNGAKLTKIEINKKIENVIKFGLNDKRVDWLFEHKHYFKKFEIAKGIKSIDGKDGKIEYEIEFAHNTVPEVLEDGTVDYKDVHMITNIKKNETIGFLIPEKKGINGRSVDGELILSKDGKKPDVKFGNNIDMDKDKRIFATKAGFVQNKKNIISVIELLEIDGDVDHSTGNIHFDGKVVIKGTVRTGFSVYARDGIDIKGVVESAELSSDGDVILKNGMHGNDKGTIKAKGIVVAKYLANCNVEAGDEIKTGAIMHSKISCNSNINVVGKNATIVGGILKSKGNINAFIIGSEVETPTTLEVGVDPELKKRYDEIQLELKHEKNQLDNLNKSIAILAKKAKAGTISDKNKVKLVSFFDEKKKAQKHIESLELEFESIEFKFENLSKGRVRIDNSIYPGVKITIGNDIMFVRKKFNRCTISKQNGEITVGPY